MATKTAPINIRVTPEVLNIIDAAASLLKVDRTVFIQQAALSEAYNVITSQRDFTLEDKVFEVFEQALTNDVDVNEAMVTLLNRESPWE